MIAIGSTVTWTYVGGRVRSHSPDVGHRQRGVAVSPARLAAARRIHHVHGNGIGRRAYRNVGTVTVTVTTGSIRV
jgi:hypothetical protein